MCHGQCFARVRCCVMTESSATRRESVSFAFLPLGRPLRDTARRRRWNRSTAMYVRNLGRRRAGVPSLRVLAKQTRKSIQSPYPATLCRSASSCSLGKRSANGERVGGENEFHVLNTYPHCGKVEISAGLAYRVFNNFLSRRRLYEYESRRPRQIKALMRRDFAAFRFQRVV
jgi:hypothetical protein